MIYSLGCLKCQSTKVVPSRLRHVHEYLLSWVLRPYRCLLCGHRELKFRYINMENQADRGAGTKTRHLRQDRD